MGHYLFEPEFCNVPAAGRKGSWRRNVRDRRTSIWHKAQRQRQRQRWDSMESLNGWLAG